MSTYNAVALFSGGLDSILAVKTIQAQGLTVKCLHFTSPFFGKLHKLKHWRKIYGVDVEPVDVSQAYIAMMARGPKYGFGKFLNPCVDCKILMLAKAREIMTELGAGFIISGEVIGQRPMSQRRDTLNVITRDAGARDVLVRPLCAGRLDPTKAELAGLVDREKLHAISGRGRKDQMRLAAEYGLTEIPTPAGGCKLAEQESAKRWLPLLLEGRLPAPEDFHLADLGRQLRADGLWLVVGRNEQDNDKLAALARPDDSLLKLKDFPGPTAVLRTPDGAAPPPSALAEAGAKLVAFTSKARTAAQESPGPLALLVTRAGETTVFGFDPAAPLQHALAEPAWNPGDKKRLSPIEFAE